MNLKVSNQFNGKAVPNQFIITTADGQMFQSYDSNIAFVANDGKITLGKDWKYSKTTTKFLNIFLNMTSKEILKAIQNDEIIIDESL